MTLLDAAYWVVCVVLVASGATKVVESRSSERALAALGLAVPPGTGRALAGAELALGAAGLLVAGSAARGVAAAVSVLHLAFAAVVVAGIRAGLDDCGCIGVRPTRPGPGHVAVNLASSAVAAAAAVRGPVDLAAGLGEVGMPGAVAVAAAVAGCAGAILALGGRKPEPRGP